MLGEYDTEGPHNVEWYDGELGELYSIDNFPPPPSLFVESVNDHLLFVSCLGKPDSSGNPTAPGPGVAVAKPNNPEAASPAAYAFVTPASDIVGVKVGKVGVRAQDSGVFFLTQDGISYGRFVDSDVSPLVINPAGSVGVSHNGSAAFAYDYLYIFTGSGLARTVDGQNIENEFSQDVSTDLTALYKGRVFVGFDPLGKRIVVFHSNDRQGSMGGWQTRAWSFNLQTNTWNTPVSLGDGIDDFTVCGVATVNQRLFMVTTDGKVWQWDAGGRSLSGFMAVNWDDFGDSSVQKFVRAVKVDGAISGKIRLYTNETIIGPLYLRNILNLTDLIAGTGSYPEYTFSNPFLIPVNTTYQVWRPNKQFRHLAWRIGFQQAFANRILNRIVIDAIAREGMQY